MCMLKGVKIHTGLKVLRFQSSTRAFGVYHGEKDL